MHGDKAYNILFLETPRKFITAKLSIRKPGSSSVLIICAWFKASFALGGILRAERNFSLSCDFSSGTN